MRRPAAVLLLSLILASTLGAQMMPPGGGHGRMPGTGRGNPMMNGGGMLASDMMEIPVAPDGTAFVLRTTTTATELVAVSAAGAIRWSYPLDVRGMALATVSGTTLVLSTLTPSGTTSELIGLSIASGARLWTVDVPGMAVGVTAYNDGFYVVSAGTTRQLQFIGNDGTVRWTVNL